MHGNSRHGSSPSSPRASADAERISDLLEPAVTAMGMDLEDVRITSAGRRRLLRVVVDADGGVSLDDIALVSRELSATLDRTTAMGEAPYTLEVSSPGVDRPLTEPKHWRRAIGRLVTVPLRSQPRSATDGRRLVGRNGTGHRDGLPRGTARRRRAEPGVRLLRARPGEDTDRVRPAGRLRRRRRGPRRDPMDIDLSVLRSLEAEKDISMDLAIKAIEDALLVAYHRTDGAAADGAGRGQPGQRSRDRLGGRDGRGRRGDQGVRRHARGLRPDRGDHRPPGHPAAAARRRGRAHLRRVRGPRGRHRRRRDPAGQGSRGRSWWTWASWRRSCRPASRCPASATCTASG